VKFFYDTTVLVAAVSVQHIHHRPSLAAYLAADKNHAGCAAHSLAEVYATLTRMPGRQRMTCEQAVIFLSEMRDRLKTIALDGDEYSSIIVDAAADGIGGGLIYDALIASCALKANANTIYTWNIDHFRRLGPEVAKRVHTP